MPRYCAVKLCRNRGGTSSKPDKRISFYPFPLQDKARLQKWVKNMRRGEWTPSRHQYLCSEHFTEHCFDVRWGIRYLKNTAIPTIFPSVQNGCENKVTLHRNPRAAPLSQAGNFECVITKSGITCQSSLPACEVTAGVSAASCLTPSIYSEEQTDSIVTMFCRKSLVSHSSDEGHLDRAPLGADYGQAFRLVPLELIKDKPPGCFLEETRPSDREHVLCHDEHSYCRPDTDKDELWSKILSLHAKILELDRREESTVAKIQTLENEVMLLKRDGAAFKEKQKVLEDCISSVLL